MAWPSIGLRASGATRDREEAHRAGGGARAANTAREGGDAHHPRRVAPVAVSAGGIARRNDHPDLLAGTRRTVQDVGAAYRVPRCPQEAAGLTAGCRERGAGEQSVHEAGEQGATGGRGGAGRSAWSGLGWGGGWGGGADRFVEDLAVHDAALTLFTTPPSLAQGIDWMKYSSKRASARHPTRKKTGGWDAAAVLPDAQRDATACYASCYGACDASRGGLPGCGAVGCGAVGSGVPAYGTAGYDAAAPKPPPSLDAVPPMPTVCMPQMRMPRRQELAEARRAQRARAREEELARQAEQAQQEWQEWQQRQEWARQEQALQQQQARVARDEKAIDSLLASFDSSPAPRPAPRPPSLAPPLAPLLAAPCKSDFLSKYAAAGVASSVAHTARPSARATRQACATSARGTATGSGGGGGGSSGEGGHGARALTERGRADPRLMRRPNGALPAGAADYREAVSQLVATRRAAPAVRQPPRPQQPGTAPARHAEPATAPGWQQPSYEQLLAAEAAKASPVAVDTLRRLAWGESAGGAPTARATPQLPPPPPPPGPPPPGPRPAISSGSAMMGEGGSASGGALQVEHSRRTLAKRVR